MLVRLLDRRVVRVLRERPGRTSLMKALFAWVGYRAAAVPQVRPSRLRGEPSWSMGACGTLH
jgi:hypothetical protein